MKILIVIDTLASGGAQKLKVQLAKGLLNRNHEVEMCIYDSNYPFYERQLRNAGIKINLFESIYGLLFLKYWKYFYLLPEDALEYLLDTKFHLFEFDRLFHLEYIY